MERQKGLTSSHFYIQGEKTRFFFLIILKKKYIQLDPIADGLHISGLNKSISKFYSKSYPGWVSLGEIYLDLEDE